MNIPFHKPIIPNNLNSIFELSVRQGWLTTGPIVTQFESQLSKYLEAKYVIAVNSCTAALHLALAAKGFNPGDKFIAPTYTFISTVEVGEYLSMEPVLIDSDKTYNIDLNKIEDLLISDSGIKCITLVHFSGKPVDMNNIFWLAKKYNIYVIEDAAHAFETVSNYGKVGDTNHTAAFSFYANKNITTGGEGGAIATNNKILAEKIRKLSLHGMSRDGWKRFKLGNKWQYDVSFLGYKYNMTDIAACFGKWQMEHFDEWYERRLLIVKAYNKSFSAIDGIICPDQVRDDEKDGHHLYIIRLNPSRWTVDRDKIIELLNEGGIGTSVHYKPVHMHSYYQRKYGYDPNDFPNAKKYFENVVSLPLYPLLKKDDIDYIINFFIQLWEKYKS